MFRQTVIAVFLVFSFIGISQENINKFDEKGLRHGVWKGLFEESKRVRYEGNFNHGKETGIFTFYDDTKVHTIVATRDFSKKPNEAYTTFFDAKGNKVSEGNVVNKEYDGKWTYYHFQAKTVMTEEFYKSGKLEGTRTVYFPNGKVAEVTNYKDGIKNGPYLKYTDKGVVMEETIYVNGEFHGPAIFRDGDGDIASKGIFKNGAKNGIWEFYENGKLVKKEKFPLVKKKAKPTAKPKAK